MLFIWWLLVVYCDVNLLLQGFYLNVNLVKPVFGYVSHTCNGSFSKLRNLSDQLPCLNTSARSVDRKESPSSNTTSHRVILRRHWGIAWSEFSHWWGEKSEHRRFSNESVSVNGVILKKYKHLKSNMLYNSKKTWITVFHRNLQIGSFCRLI